MRIRFASCCFVLLAVLLVACGSSPSGGGTSSTASSSSPPASGGGGGGTGSATLTWDGPTTNADASALTDLAGYRVYRSTTSGSHGATPAATVAASSAAPQMIPTISATVTNLASGTHYFIVRAYDSSGNESANSPERSKTIP